jgi:hypothetical protein
MMLLAKALERSPIQMATRNLEDGEQVVHSVEHGTFLKRKGKEDWEHRPEFAEAGKGDWEPVQPGFDSKKLVEAIEKV